MHNQPLSVRVETALGIAMELKDPYVAIIIQELYESNQSTREQLNIAIAALEKYGDMIVLDSEDRPHDVGHVAREAILAINAINVRTRDDEMINRRKDAE